MNIADISSPERLCKINSPRFVRMKLSGMCSALFILAFAVGAIINHFCAANIPDVISRDMTKWLYIGVEKDNFVDFLSTIIFNSVDIFKISFIIILSGFTYLSGTVSRVTAIVYGLTQGFELLFCIDKIFSDGIVRNSWLAVILLVCSWIFCYLIFIRNCVLAELTSDRFAKFQNPKKLLVSEVFWKYIGGFMVSFGYIVIDRILYGLLMRIL